MRFCEEPYLSGVYQDVFKTWDNHMIETAVYTGLDYENMTFISITTQIGCHAGCSFCEVSRLPLVRNLSIDELTDQVKSVFINVNNVNWLKLKKTKISLGRAGEPLLNPNIVSAVSEFAFNQGCDIQLFSIFPEAPIARKNLLSLENIAMNMPGIFQVTVSLHATTENERNSLIQKGKHMKFEDISMIAKKWVRNNPKRKFNLSLILIEGVSLDFIQLSKIFSPDFFCVRLAYYLPTSEEIAQRHHPSGDERLEKEIFAAKVAGFDVIASPAGPIERIWDTRPFSAFNMLRLPLRPKSKNQNFDI